MVLLCATGHAQHEIAERLGISRFAVRRRIEVLRRRWNFDFVAAMNSVEPMSGLIVRFAERRGHENGDIAFAVRSLAGFSLKELGVLFAIVKEQPQEQALDAISISRSHYIRIRNGFIGMFGMGNRYPEKSVCRIIGKKAAKCGIIEGVKTEEHIVPIAAAVISGGIMACDEAAQNAAVHASCIPPCYQQSGVTPPDAHLGAGLAQGKSNKTSLANSLPRTRQCVDVDALSRDSANSQKGALMSDVELAKQKSMNHSLDFSGVMFHDTQMVRTHQNKKSAKCRDSEVS